jgi:hypothetical protein
MPPKDAHIAQDHPSPSAYQRRAAEDTLLYKTVQKHFARFLADSEAEQKPVPAFVRKEFEAYLRCGILAYGFARIHCAECKYDRLVAFSCKRRGFCGSCMARRMSETAAHIVDSVIPCIPTRQWVLSVPAPFRLLIAYDSEALSVVVSVFKKAVFSWLKRKAKHEGFINEAAAGLPGSITFIQRFGSALNLNCHLHTVFSDGVYTEQDDEELTFHQLPEPTLQEARAITEKIARKVHQWLTKRMDELVENNFAEKEPLLAACYEASTRYLAALGRNAGQPIMRVFGDIPESTGKREERTVAGFNLHVSRSIGKNDRSGLERQLRYMGRPPLSNERLTEAANGNLIVKLKTAWRDGTSYIVLTPTQFLERLVAIIPPPRKHQIRFHGVFAPNARVRKQVVPKKDEAEAKPESTEAKQAGNPESKKSFAKLIARVFDIDVLCCPRCKSKMQVISFITETQTIRDILKSLKMATAPPEMAKTDTREQQSELVYEYE